MPLLDHLAPMSLGESFPSDAECQETADEVAMLGAAYRRKALREMVLDREPCDGCKANMARGITLIEAHEDGTPTGRWMVVTEEGIRHVAQPAELVEAILKERRALVDTEAYGRLAPRPT